MVLGGRRRRQRPSCSFFVLVALLAVAAIAVLTTTELVSRELLCVSWARVRGRDAQVLGGARVTVVEQVETPQVLVLFTDDLGRSSQGADTSEEPLVLLMLPGHRAVALPPVATQLVEAAVVPGTRIGVGGDDRRRKSPACARTSVSASVTLSNSASARYAQAIEGRRGARGNRGRRDAVEQLRLGIVVAGE